MKDELDRIVRLIANWIPEGETLNILIDRDGADVFLVGDYGDGPHSRRADMTLAEDLVDSIDAAREYHDLSVVDWSTE